MFKRLVFSSPLRLIAAFWLVAALLFFFDFYGAYERAPNKLLLVVYMALQIFILLCIDRIRIARLPPIMRSPKSARLYFNAALLISMFMLPLNIHFYSGSQLSDFFTMLTNPVTAYARMHEAVGIDRSERLSFLMIKLVFSWLTVALVPLAIILRQRRLVSLPLFSLALLLPFVLSVFRGTDKETGDILVFLIAGVFIREYANRDPQKLTPDKGGFRLFSRKTLAPLLGGVIFLYLMSFRKGERLVGTFYFCFANSDACMAMPNSTENPFGFLFAMLYGYVTHSFYGLSVAFDADQVICPFVGHSSVLLYLAGLINLGCNSTILGQLDQLNWASAASWSTGFVQLANDFGFFGTFFQIAIYAFALKIFYRTYMETGDYLSGILYFLNFFILFYMVANLQLQQVGEQYFGYIFLNIFVVIASLWKAGRRS